MTPRWVRVALVAVAVAAAASIAAVGPWVVDDAAIAWAFARNWAQGHGLVTFAGGERVEGYSDFLWVALIALGERLGIDAWSGAKALGVAFTVGTVPLVYRLAGVVHPRHPVLAGLVAAAVFATDTQVAVFGASGLENALFSFLLALGLCGTLHELEHRSTPWSALAFLGLALTRPEGIVYAALAGVVTLARTDRDAAGARRLGTWLALFWVPFAAYHGVRYWYFAWPFPMTYYAKVHEPLSSVLDGRSAGWRYLGGYVRDLGREGMLPLLAVGRTGLRDRRSLAALALLLVGGSILAFGPTLPALAIALGWSALLGCAALPGLADRGSRGAGMLVWSMGLTSALFAVYAQGDWMGQFRWLSFASVPFATLAGAGLATLAPSTRPAVGWVAGLSLVVVWGVGNGLRTHTFSDNPDFSPFSVRQRVAFARSQWRTLHVDERQRLTTVDMGGFMLYSTAAMQDWVGLVDVTFGVQGGQHRRSLRKDWIPEQVRPHQIFVMPTEVDELRRIAAVRQDYLQVLGDELVRRDLLFGPSWSGPGPVVDTGPVVLYGLWAPGGPVTERVYVELGLSAPEAEPFSARVVAFDAAGVARVSWPVPLGARIAPPMVWRPDEIHQGRYQLELPADLEPGTWRLGIRLQLDGAPLVPAVLPEGVTVDGTGTLSYGTTFEVATPEEVDRAIDASLAALPDDCAEAERAWFLARRRRTDPTPVDLRHGPRVRADLATCWARAAASATDPVSILARARDWDATAPGVAEAALEKADELQVQCDEHRAARAWEPCTEACDDVLRLDPTRAWTRRTAERCRAVWYTQRERKR